MNNRIEAKNRMLLAPRLHFRLTHPKQEPGGPNLTEENQKDGVLLGVTRRVSLKRGVKVSRERNCIGRVRHNRLPG